jgi:hypothetical protein
VETNSILLLAVKLAVAEREGAMDVEEAEEEEEDAVTVDMTFAHLIPNIRILLPASYVKPPPFPPCLSLSLLCRPFSHRVALQDTQTEGGVRRLKMFQDCENKNLASQIENRKIEISIQSSIHRDGQLFHPFHIPTSLRTHRHTDTHPYRDAIQKCLNERIIPPFFSFLFSSSSSDLLFLRQTKKRKTKKYKTRTTEEVVRPHTHTHTETPVFQEKK